MHHEFNKNLLATFDILTQDLIQENSHFSRIDNDIFFWKNRDVNKEDKQFDLIINFCTHGNETIGLCIANHLLLLIQKHQLKSSLNIVFSLANRNAVLANKRFITKDLNRSFSKKSSPTCEEEQRAKDLEIIASQSFAILDIHQTTSDSLSPFFVLKDISYNYNFFEALDIHVWPMILYKEDSFSKDGEAYSSYAMHNKIPFMTIELGLAGSNLELENYFSTKIKELVEKYNSVSWKEIFSKIDWKKPQVDCYHEYKNIERLTDDDYLIDGLKNLSLIEKNAIYAYQNAIPLKEEFDVYALFPKYGVYRKISAEILRLLKRE